MNERDIFNETKEIKKANYACSFCGQRNEYEVRWLKRIKKKNPQKNLSVADKSRFEKSRDYMVRIDDQLMCKNNRCRRRFEIPTSQSVVFI